MILAQMRHNNAGYKFWRSKKMRFLAYFIFLSLIQACDPYGFGFKKNPAFILNEAFEAVLSLKVDAFLEVSGREALCVYGNENGLNYLRDKLNVRVEDLELRPQRIENHSKHLNPPHFVGYWSYYRDRYIIDIAQKKSANELLKVIVDCHYGFDGKKDDKYVELKVKKYKIKECRLIKIIPTAFTPLPVPQKCDNLKVNFSL
jgi:hypothetical protein